VSIAFDKSTSSASGSVSPPSFTHTPVGTPALVVVCIGQDAIGDQVTGVTYGGVAMTRGSFKAHATNSTVYVYYLVAGIPTGVQSVIATCTGNVHTAQCSTFTAAAAVTAGTPPAGTSGTSVSPSITLSAITGATWVCAAADGGASAMTAIPAGSTSLSTAPSTNTPIVNGTDDGTWNHACCFKTTDTADTMTYTNGASDTWAMVAVPFTEAVAATKLPLLVMAPPVTA
jgi:hypothetical protein